MSDLSVLVFESQEVRWLPDVLEVIDLIGDN
jgi:hypothetical protein